MEIKGIRYVGPVMDSSGYARACRGNILALHDAGVPITISPISFESIHPDLGKEGEVLKSLVDKRLDYNVNIMHSTPEFWKDLRVNSVTNVGYTIWETTKLHPKWIPNINNNVTKVLVGCEWNKEVFKDSGINIPIGVVPHGIDPNRFDNVSPYNISNVGKDDYVFYSIFQWTERKHPTALIKAYYNAFTGVDDVVLVLKTYRSDYTDREKDAIRTTIKRLKYIMPLDHYPRIVYISDILSEDEIASLHSRGDCYVSLDRGEGFGLCVAKHTKISIPDGVKNAEDIEIGDEVLSVDGRFHKVSGVSKKYVSKGLKITTKLHEAIVVSEEHPFLSSDAISKHKRYNHTPEDIENLLEWREAGYLSINDYVAIPKPIVDNNLEQIDILSLIDINCVVEKDSLYLVNGFSPKNTKYSYKNLVNTYGYTKKIFETAVKHLKFNTAPKENTAAYKALSILIDIGYESKTPNKVNRYVELTEDVLSLFGWYLAEGSTNNDTFLELDLHKNEYDIVLSLANIFKEKFGVSENSIFTEMYENKSRLIVSSKIISSLFSNMFGKGANNKHIPGWLFKSGQNLIPMIKSLFEGDGHNDGATYALTTVSPCLAYQVKLLLNSFGYCPRINCKGKSSIGNYDRYIVSLSNNDYRLFIDKTPNNIEQKFFIETPNFYIVKVVGVEEIDYSDNMFDFTIEGGKSFVGNGLLLHNCPFEAGAAGNPIIITGFGGATEYAKPHNSYLVDYNLTPVFGMPWCMSLNSLVKTDVGYLKAKDLEQGTEVVNKNLNFKKINKIEFRPLIANEKVYSFRSFSFPEEMELTSDHKLYVIENDTPVKKKVSDINVGDYLFVPKPNVIQTIPTYLEDKHFISFDDIKTKKLNEIFYIFGLYLAEGHIDKGEYSVGFSFNLSEKLSLGKKCKDIMKEVFKIDDNNTYERDLEDRNGYEIYFHCKNAVECFKNCFGTGSHDKYIIDEIKYNSLNYELLKGYWDGDGHIRKEGYKCKKLKKKRISPECIAETASFDLSMDIRDILLSLDIVPSLRKSIRKDGRKSYIISVSDKEFDKIFGVKANRINSKYKIKLPGNAGFGVLVTKKELLVDYDDLICSISVDTDDDETDGTGGSYILNGIASSNSPWYQGDQMWAEPNVWDGINKMKYVYDNKSKAREKGLKLQKDIANNFSWSAIAKRIINELKSI